MTLKELITRVSFDDMLPYLKEHERARLDNLYAFREAYDILRNMEPAADYQGEIHVEWSGGEYGEAKWIGVYHMDDADWDEDLAKEIVVADDVRLSLEELAMRCLWEITYWGFSPEERDETWKREFGPRQLTNLYEVALDRLHESIWRHQTPRKLRCRGRNGERYTRVVFPLKWNYRENRSKRKRAYRQGKREAYLRKMATRENLVRTLSANGSSFRRDDVDFLLRVNYGCRYNYRSVTAETEGRLAYIATSMTRYQQLDLSRYEKAIVFLRVPRCYPLSEAEMANFKQVVRTTLGYKDILFGSIAEDGETKDVKVLVLLYQ